MIFWNDKAVPLVGRHYVQKSYYFGVLVNLGCRNLVVDNLAYAINMILTKAKVIKNEMVDSFFISRSISQSGKKSAMIYCRVVGVLV